MQSILLFQPFVKKLDEFAEAISEDARCLLSHVTSSSVTSHTSLIMCGKRTSLDLGLNPELTKKASIAYNSDRKLKEKFSTLIQLSSPFLISSHSSLKEVHRFFYGKRLLSPLQQRPHIFQNLGQDCCEAPFQPE